MGLWWPIANTSLSLPPFLLFIMGELSIVHFSVHLNHHLLLQCLGWCQELYIRQGKICPSVTKTKPHCFQPGRSSYIPHKAAMFNGQNSVGKLLCSTRTLQEPGDFPLLLHYPLESCWLWYDGSWLSQVAHSAHGKQGKRYGRLKQDIWSLNTTFNHFPSVRLAHPAAREAEKSPAEQLMEPGRTITVE